MPNLINSLDASSIAILYSYLSKNKITDIYTVHDCFAVTANNVETLISDINTKSVYLYIYTGSEYITNLDNLIKETIISQFGKDKFSSDGKYVYVGESKKILFPDIGGDWKHIVIRPPSVL